MYLDLGDKTYKNTDAKFTKDTTFHEVVFSNFVALLVQDIDIMIIITFNYYVSVY